MENIKFNQLLDDFKKKERRRSKDYREEMERREAACLLDIYLNMGTYIREHGGICDNVREHVSRHIKKLVATWPLRPGNKHDYERWLYGYLERGGQPTHFYDRPFSRCGFKVAEGDFDLLPLWGALALKIIIPEGISMSIHEKGLGHNNCYWVDGFKSSCFVPIYSDTQFLLREIKGLTKSGKIY